MASSSRELLRAARLCLGAGVCLMAGALAAQAVPRRGTADPVAASRRLKEHTLAPLVRTATGITRDLGALAIVEHDGSDYSRLEPDGTPNYAARARVTRAFYEDHGDLYDFVAVFTNFPFDAAGAVGFHNLVRNDVSGIGLPEINNGPLFGSPGRLKGYVDMGPIGQYRGPPFSTDPGAPGFREAVDVLAHELGHQWLARVRYRDAGGAASADLLGLDQSHWSYLLDSDASFFYGSDWLPAGAGVYRASRVQQAYSSLDLYLMGLLDPARVAPFTLLRNPAVSPDQPPEEGATVEAVPETIGVAQVISAEGPRQPDHRASQKDFRIGFIVLAAPGVEPSSEDLEAIDHLRDAFEARFFALTRGVAFADTTLAEEPLPPPAPAADLDRALVWLRTRQALDGRWEDVPGSALRDTGSVLAALDASGDTSATYARGHSWMRAATAASVDFTARRASALALEPLAAATRDDLLAAIHAQRNADGGFGAARGYESDALDTALALRALRDLGSSPSGAVRGALLELGLLRLPVGGWELVPGRGASSLATAHVVLALHDWIDLPEASSLVGPAVAHLGGRQNPDGGFGESPSTAHGTAQALLALDRAGAPVAIVESSGRVAPANAAARGQLARPLVRDRVGDRRPQSADRSQPGCPPGRPGPGPAPAARGPGGPGHGARAKRGPSVVAPRAGAVVRRLAVLGGSHRRHDRRSDRARPGRGRHAGVPDHGPAGHAPAVRARRCGCTRSGGARGRQHRLPFGRGGRSHARPGDPTERRRRVALSAGGG